MGRGLNAFVNVLLVGLCIGTMIVMVLTIKRVTSFEHPATHTISSAAVKKIEDWTIDLKVRDTAAKTAKPGRLVIVEFSDFQCPFCARFTAETLPQLRRQYIDPGRVHYEFVLFPLAGSQSLAAQAAAASVCAKEQGTFAQMHDRLFSRTERLAEQHLVELAREVGLDIVAFQKCLTTRGVEQVARNVRQGLALGVTGTPTFFVGRIQQDNEVRLLREIRGAEPFATFVSVLRELDGSRQAWFGLFD